MAVKSFYYDSPRNISERRVCGAGVFTTYWLYKFFRFKDPMLSACKVHDQAWERHQKTVGGIGPSSEPHDKKFYDNMTRLIQQQENPLLLPIMYLQRKEYYRMVRVYGAKNWGVAAGILCDPAMKLAYSSCCDNHKLV